MRVYFITQDDPLYVGEFFRKFLSLGLPSGVQVCGIAVVAASRRFLHSAQRWFTFWGWLPFTLLAIRRLIFQMVGSMASLGLLPGPPRSMEAVSRLLGVLLYRASDVNEERFIRHLRQHVPDLIISISAPQRFGRELLASARIGCLNLHNGALPRYRGAMPVFWQLQEGCREIGITLHWMNEKLDDGPILLQQAVAVSQTMSLHEVMCLAKQFGAILVRRALEQIRDGRRDGFPNRSEEGVTYPFPGRDSVKTFTQQGWRLV